MSHVEKASHFYTFLCFLHQCIHTRVRVYKDIYICTDNYERVGESLGQGSAEEVLDRQVSLQMT